MKKPLERFLQLKEEIASAKHRENASCFYCDFDNIFYGHLWLLYIFDLMRWQKLYNRWL